MNGGERIRWAGAHERTAGRHLMSRGYTVERFGQALLSPQVRRELSKTDSLLRWLADLAVMGPGRPLTTVDAKCTLNRATGNHSVELRSLLASRIVGLPVFFVCDDLRYFTADDAVDWAGRFCCAGCRETFVRGGSLDGDVFKTSDALPGLCPDHYPKGRRGSGTPFLLFPAARCRDLDQVFPAVPHSGVVA